MSSDSQRFASMIDGLRAGGRTLRAVAKDCGVSPATIWRLAEGEAKAPSHETVQRIEKAWERAGRPVGK